MAGLLFYPSPHRRGERIQGHFLLDFHNRSRGIHQNVLLVPIHGQFGLVIGLPLLDLLRQAADLHPFALFHDCFPHRYWKILDLHGLFGILARRSHR